MNREYVTSNLVDELLKQKEAHDSIVSALKQRITDLERECLGKEEEKYIQYLFFTRRHPELIPEFVELAYKNEPRIARKAVADFHDETLDLSTLECTGSDFKPW